MIIETVENLPDDCNDQVTDLLLQYTAKPSEGEIAELLNSSMRVSRWFATTPTPTIRQLNLDCDRFTGQLTGDETGATTHRLPIIGTVV